MNVNTFLVEKLKEISKFIDKLEEDYKEKDKDKKVDKDKDNK